MKLALIPALALTVGALAACDRPVSTSTTVVKEPVVQKETVIREQPSTSTSTTIVQPSAAPAPTDAKPAESTTEVSKTRTTERVDTPMGTATRTETTRTETTK